MNIYGAYRRLEKLTGLHLVVILLLLLVFLQACQSFLFFPSTYTHSSIIPPNTHRRHLVLRGCFFIGILLQARVQRLTTSPFSLRHKQWTPRQWDLSGLIDGFDVLDRRNEIGTLATDDIKKGRAISQARAWLQSKHPTIEGVVDLEQELGVMVWQVRASRSGAHGHSCVEAPARSTSHS